MKQWLSNLLGGAATVLQLSPPPIQHRFGRKYLDRSIEDAFREDMAKVARDMNAAIAVVYGQVNHDRSGQQPLAGQRSNTPGGADTARPPGNGER